jgi:hypothetical protein
MVDISKGKINEKVFKLLIEKMLIKEAGIDNLCKYYKDKILYLLNKNKKSYSSSIMLYVEENTIANFLSLTILFLLSEENYDYVIVPIEFNKDREKVIICVWVEDRKLLEFKILYFEGGNILYKDKIYREIDKVVEQIRKDYKQERMLQI